MYEKQRMFSILDGQTPPLSCKRSQALVKFSQTTSNFSSIRLPVP